MPTLKDFSIEKCKDCIRITRLDIKGDKHCHVTSRKLAETIIHNVCSGKIPLHSRSYTLISMMRLSDDKNYIKKIQKILDVRERKDKQTYVNCNISKKNK